MRILTLELKNFQGIKSLKLDFDGKDAKIFGRNATGKTTVANAITWLLTGKAYTGEKDYTPKTVAGEDYMHQVEHSAEMSFVLENGEGHSIKKVYKEIWTKKRGRSEAEMTGNTTDCFLNEIPASATEFNQFITEKFGKPDRIQMLTRPDFFAEALDWKTRREILLNIVGNVSDEDVINSDKLLQELPELQNVNNKTISIPDLKKLSEVRRREAKSSLNGMNERIDENQQALTDEPISLKEAEKAVKAAQKALSDHEVDKSKGKDTSAEERIQKLSGERMSIIFERRNFVLKAQEEVLAKKQAVADQVREFKDKIADFESEKRAADRKIAECQCDKETLEKQREKILREMRSVYDSTFSGDTHCPLCGAEYPADKVAELLAGFNRQKSERLEQLQEDGRKVSKDVIAQYSKEIQAQEKAIQKLDKSIRAAEAKIQEIEAGAVFPEAKADTSKFDERLKAIEAEIAALQEAGNDAEGEDLEGIRLQSVLDAANEQLNAVKRNQEIKKRIEDLHKETKRLSAILEEAERAIFLCERFTQCKAEMLTEKINSHFETVRFRLFRQLVNGGLEDACDVLIDDKKGNFVPFQSANNAARINAGIEIIEALSKAWELSLPIVIDNAESVNAIRPSEAQQIQLIVTESDKKLRIEKQED